MEKAKKDYYSACKQEKSALNQETNARNDGSTAEQVHATQIVSVHMILTHLEIIFLLQCV